MRALLSFRALAAAALTLGAALSPAHAAKAEAPPPPAAQNWPSPDGLFQVTQSLYGEGKQIKPVFINVATGHRADFVRGGVRQFTILWSPDGRFLAANLERSPRYGEAHLYAVRAGRLSEITLPMGLTSLPPENAGKTVFGEEARVLKWIDNEQFELLSTIDLQRAADHPSQAIARHFTLRIVKNQARIVPAPAAP